MMITREQQIFLLAKSNHGQPGLWHGACEAQGWNPEDREFRLSKLSEIVGRKLESTSEIERVEEFTKVKNELLMLQRVNLQAAMEGRDTTENRARILRHKIVTELIPCLELYVEDVRGYLTAIMEDKNRWWKIDRPVRDITIIDLDAKPVFRTDKRTGKPRQWPSLLEQLQFTLAARLNDKRKAAGDTIHDMRLKAHLPCHCAKCSHRKLIISPLVPQPEPDMHDVPF